MGSSTEPPLAPMTNSTPIMTDSARDVPTESDTPPVRSELVLPPESKQYISSYKSALPPMFEMLSRIAESNNIQDRSSHLTASPADYSDIESENPSPVAGGDDDWMSPAFLHRQKSQSRHSGNTDKKNLDGMHDEHGEDGDEGEEMVDQLGTMPNEGDLNRHAVFRSPTLESQDLAVRLAQLSVSNFVGSSRSEHGFGDTDNEGFTPSRTSSQTSSTKIATGEDELTDEEKMEAIIDVFGAYVELGEEKYVSESRGGFFKGIVILGNFYLTTHRITFNAIIPSPNLTERTQGSDSTSMIIKAGPVTVHRNTPYKKRKKVWLELGSETCSLYPDATEEGRTRPHYTILLSSCKKILPDDPEDPLSIKIAYTSPRRGVLETRRFTFGTREAALSWRREFEGALFHVERMQLLQRKSSSTHETSEASAESAGFGKKEDWDLIKISIPLERITKHEVSDYMAFATMLVLSVDNNSPGGQPTDPNPSDVEGDSLLNIQFALLSSQMYFIEALENSLKLAQQRTDSSDTTSAKPLFEFSGSSKSFMRKAIGLPDSDDEEEEEEENEEEEDQETPTDRGGREKLSRLRAIFGLTKAEPIWATRCGLSKGILGFSGQLIVSPRFIGFYRKSMAQTTMYRFPVHDVKGASPSSAFHIAVKELILQIAGHADMHFSFLTKSARDETVERINSAIETNAKNASPSTSRFLENALPSNKEEPISRSSSITGSFEDYSRSIRERDDASGKSNDSARARKIDSMWAPIQLRESTMRGLTDKQYNYRAKIVNTSVSPHASSRVIEARHFVMLTIGSRGDIQPYIALSLGLMKHGHRCTIVTHDEFKKWIESYNIGYRQAGGDPAALMKLSIEHKMFSPGWFKESLGSYREWFDELMHDAWVACQDADVLIESPSAMVGIHIAEALQIPYFRAFTMPWTRTHDVPHAFMTPAVDLPINFNYATYVLFDNIIWKATAGPINRWRKRELGLKSTNMELLEARNVPFIYNFSSAVLPHPIDWKDNIMISGYWFLANSDAEWSAPDSLIAFMEQAREDGKPLIYIGFGSIVVPDPAEMTKNVIRAVEKADVRAIVAKGWSSRGQDQGLERTSTDVPFPNSCYSIDKIPHDWLFPKIDACVHHGGAGTTGASLRWGRPTIIKPWFGDQFCWASQVTKLNVGVRVTTLSGPDLTNALIKVTHDKILIEAAAKIGERIRSEDGVGTAIEYLYSYLDRARDRHVPYTTEPVRSLPVPKLSFPFNFST